MEAVVSRLGLDALGAAFLRTLRLHRWPLGLLLFYVASGHLFAAWLDLPARVNSKVYDWMILTLLATGALLFGVGYIIYVMVGVRPNELTRYLRDDFRQRFCQPERVFGLAIAIAMLPPLFSTMSTMKTLIPAVQPYAWDPIFSEWDRLLHFGSYPWELLQPALGTPAVTFVVNVAYNFWFFVVYGVVFWQAANHGLSVRRLQFFIAFVLTWMLLGTLGATLFSSAGPVYYGRVTGLEDPYAPLMTYLYGVHEILPVWALNAQELLWNAYSADFQIPGGGISAMPSMHLASTWLFTLAVLQHSRKVGALFVVYTAIIEIGSVHLGWHYAIDGYFAIAATSVIWWIAGKIAERELKGLEGFAPRLETRAIR